VDTDGKIRRKFLLGESKKRSVHWHFAVEARPVFAKIPRICLFSHVAFTHDGCKEFVQKGKMHSLRRQFCKNWWNDRWRDLLSAYLTWLFEGRDRVALPNEESLVGVISGRPLIFRSQVSVAMQE